jgi:hypothetical protein
MGSLASRPKVPSNPQPQIVYMQQPAYQPPPTPKTPMNNGDAQGDETSAAKAREESLLTRDRSRYGTVTTSFRGLLNLASNGGGQKKTLLGE